MRAQWMLLLSVVVIGFSVWAIPGLTEADFRLAERIRQAGIAPSGEIGPVPEGFKPDRYWAWLNKKGRKDPLDASEALNAAGILARASLNQQQKQATMSFRFAQLNLAGAFDKGLALEDAVFRKSCADYLAVYEMYHRFYPNPKRIAEIASVLDDKPGRPPLSAANRSFWERGDVRALYPKAIPEAEEILSKRIPALTVELYDSYQKTGKNTDYEKPYFERGANLGKLLTAECLESRGRFLPAITNYLVAICEEGTWVLPSHARCKLASVPKDEIDLFSSARAMLLARVCDVLGERLPVTMRNLVLKRICERVIDPYLREARQPKRNSFNWWYMANNNWNAVVNSCCVRTMLLVTESKEARAEAIESIERTTPYFIAGFGEDGYCSEGAAYWNYGFGHHLMAGLAVRRATHGQSDLFADPKNRRIMAYAYGYEIDKGVRPCFSDGGGRLQDGFLKLGRVVWPDLSSSRGELTKPDAFGFDSLDVWFNDGVPLNAKPTMDVLPMRTVFDSAQVFILRPDPSVKTPRLACAIKGGHNNELHNHNDLGSYDIVLNGVAMEQDPGVEQYTARTFSKRRYESEILNSFGHPVPVVGGKLQSVGAKFSAKVISTEFTATKDTVVLDLKGAYELPTLKRLVRTLVYDRVANIVSVTDEVAFSSPESFATAAVTYQSAEVSGGNGYLLKGKDGGTVTLRARADGGELVLNRRTLNRKPWQCPERLEFALDAPVSSAAVTLVYSATYN